MTDAPASQHPLLEILANIRQNATSERGKGDLFERLMVSYFQTDPVYKDRFSEVCLWMEWSGRGGKTDTGIDIVARERESGRYCAIQCKCYAEKHRVSLEDTSTFFAMLGQTWPTENGREKFESGIVVSTALSTSTHFDEAIRDSEVPCHFIGLKNLMDSRMDWEKYKATGKLELQTKYQPKAHQEEAIRDVIAGFESADRGKLIMACGTGKTFTALRLAERYCGAESNILFLVPSIALLSQSLREWMNQAEGTMHAIAVCSDPTASQGKGGRGRKSAAQEERDELMDMPERATTDMASVGQQYAFWRKQGGMVVVFSTYQSLPVIAEAQKFGRLPEFDLTICDEAHRTTGVAVSKQDKYELSNFMLIHDGKQVLSKKRLYMTATPRIYSESARKKAEEADCLIASMDDIDTYGEELHRLPFSKAVSHNLLTDYKVLILCVDEDYVREIYHQEIPREADNADQLCLEDAVKLMGCYNGLRKKVIGPHMKSKVAGSEAEEVVEEDLLSGDHSPMRRAVAFTDTIAHSKLLCGNMSQLVQLLVEDEIKSGTVDENRINCPTQHVDGAMNAAHRNERLAWLSDEPAVNECRILTNVRCLSEGVDVPALDAVMFLSPRRSQVDIVQAVGRVMRKAPGKQYGYIILPISTPAGEVPEDVLDKDNKYDVVWDVLQALRAHDDRFNAEINQLQINHGRGKHIVVGGVGRPKGTGSSCGKKRGDDTDGSPGVIDTPDLPGFDLSVDKWRMAILAQVVKKCGTRRYWEMWSKDIAKIAIRQQDAITMLIEEEDTKATFEKFLEGLRKNINPAISQADAVEMLAQQAITKPVFEALFGGEFSFASHNPVSQTMDAMLQLVHEQTSDDDRAKLADFYESVKARAAGVDNAEGKQKVIVELYNSFFKHAFPKLVEKYGIVYTEVPLVDYMIHSVHHVLQKEFDKADGLGAKGVRVLDPFTGTGTFIVRLIQSGLISKEDLPRKYKEELFAIEIVLFAYYIACVNIEDAYHGVMRNKEYEPFGGACLTDTFRMKARKKAGFLSNIFHDNAERVRRLNEQDIRVIIGNPPYSIGQKNEDDNNKNDKYDELDSRIAETYVAQTEAGLLKGVYDSYVRAFRWSSDRLGDEGVIAYITNGGYIDKPALSGFRNSLLEEFSSIYCFNLRGFIRGKTKEDARKEGQNVFNIMTGVCITILVKKKGHKGKGQIYYHDIGDYLTREEKFKKIAADVSIGGTEWVSLEPDKHGDWLCHRDPAFSSFTAIGDKEAKGTGKARAIFDIFSLGVVTNRDAWCYNSSKTKLEKNMVRSIEFYNTQLGKEEKELDINSLAVSWTRSLRRQAARGKVGSFQKAHIVPAIYRPFYKSWLYFDRSWNEMVYQQPRLFPTPNQKNLAICISSIGARKKFSCYITQVIPDLNSLEAGAQCFPLYWYEQRDPNDNALGLDLDTRDGDYIRHDAITDWALMQFRRHYNDPCISREDIFYYVYGVLHSPEYARRFEANLKKEMPRIPFARRFWDFSRAGRELAEWHLHYETVQPYELTVVSDGETNFRVVKMRFAGKEKRNTIIYNKTTTISGIPAEAHEYIVNGKSALEWVMERYQVTTDKASGITNDPNDWCEEHGDPRYIIDLVGRVVRVSVETVRIVKSLPPLEEMK